MRPLRAIDGTSLVLPGWVSAHSHAFQYGLRGHTQRAPGETGTFWSWREAMFSLEPDLAESAYQEAFHQTVARFRRRSLIVVFTDLVSAAVEQALLPALPILTRRHLVMVAAVQDPSLGRWAHDGPHEWAGEAFRAASAANQLHQRRTASARLRAAGAIGVDAEPGRLAVETVEAYLEVKASGRL